MTHPHPVSAVALALGLALVPAEGAHAQAAAPTGGHESSPTPAAHAAVAPSSPVPHAPASADPAIRAIAVDNERLETGRGDERYDPAGRRDPFVDPTGVPSDESVLPGLPGMRLGEVRLQGLTLVAGEPVALLLGSDGLGYSVREADRLRDARVVTIDFAHGRVVFQQETQDPGAATRYRSVVRELAP